MKGPVLRYRLFLVAIVIGMVASAAILAQRWSVEARYRTVEIVLDGVDWEALAAREGKDADAFLRTARERGATSVGVLERTLKRLADQGLVAYLSTGDLLTGAKARGLSPEFQALVSGGKIHPRAVYIAAPPQMVQFLEDAYRGLLGPARIRRVGRLLQVIGPRDDIEEIGIGYLPQDLERYRRLGLIPVLRMRNYDGLTAEGLKHLFGRLHQIGRGYTLVFELQEVLGTDQLIDETADAMHAGDDRYGRIEVFNVRRKQRGEDLLAQRMRPDVIRLFSLTPEELSQLTPAEARDKFVLAARERNIRLLYLRPLNARAGVVSSEANLDYLVGIVADLQRFAFRLGRAQPLVPMVVPPILLLGVSLGALAALGLVLVVLGETLGASIPVRWIWGPIIVGLFITLAFAAVGHVTLWRKLLALAVAATVPAVAILVTFPRKRSFGPLWHSLQTLWGASVISVVTGLLVAALLSQWEFMMAADQFLGVKVAHVLPVALVVLLLWGRDQPQRPWRETVHQIWTRLARPLVLWHAIVVVVVGLAAGILLGRSGNLGLPVLGAEARLRAVTETHLVARPRTKEYLVGHPALIVAVAVATVGWRTAAYPLAAVGAIGQAGIVNSFSHIHTPLLYAFWRTANALILGSVLGLIVAAIIVKTGTRYSLRSGP